jgi:hypothetical protein
MSTFISDLNLGDTVKDKPTEFTGTIGGIAFYRFSPPLFLVEPKVTESSKFPEGVWLGEERLELIPPIDPVIPK